jgi:hypothetical protein
MLHHTRWRHHHHFPRPFAACATAALLSGQWRQDDDRALYLSEKYCRRDRAAAPPNASVVLKLGATEKIWINTSALRR